LEPLAGIQLSVRLDLHQAVLAVPPYLLKLLAFSPCHQGHHGLIADNSRCVSVLLTSLCGNFLSEAPFPAASENFEAFNGIFLMGGLSSFRKPVRAPTSIDNAYPL